MDLGLVEGLPLFVLMLGLGLGPQQPGKGQLEPNPLELPLGEPWAQQPHKWGFPLWLRGLICVGTHSGLPRVLGPSCLVTV